MMHSAPKDLQSGERGGLPLTFLRRLGQYFGPGNRGARQYRRIRQELSQMDFASSEEVNRLSLEKLLQTVRYAGRKSRYYGELFRESGIDPDGIQTFEEFREIPFLTKELVQVNLSTMATGPRFMHSPAKMTTGGSTGIPLVFYVDREQSLRERAFFHHYWGALVGYKPGDRLIRLRGDKIPGEALCQYYKEENVLGLSSYHINRESVRKYIQWISEFKPKYFHVYPSAMYQFVRMLEQEGIEFPETGLRGILCGSENVYDFQRRKIQEVMRVPAISWYGHAEGTVLAFECEKSSEYHFVPMYGFVEFIDGAGKPTSRDGELVEIVGTGFMNQATPFIRYRTMDFGIVSGGPCACGRAFPRLRRIEGRLQELIVTASGRLISMTAMNMHNNTFDNVKQFQYRQSRRGHVELQIVQDEHYSESDTGRIDREIRNKLGNDMELTLRFVDDIPRTKSGKFRFLIQELPDIANLMPKERIQE